MRHNDFQISFEFPLSTGFKFCLPNFNRMSHSLTVLLAGIDSAQQDGAMFQHRNVLQIYLQRVQLAVGSNVSITKGR